MGATLEPIQSTEAGPVHALDPAVLWKMVIAAGIGFVALVALSNWHRWRVRQSARRPTKGAIPQDPIMAELASAMHPDDSAKAVTSNKPSAIPAEGAPLAPGNPQAPPILKCDTQTATSIRGTLTLVAEVFHKLNRSSDEVERLTFLRELLTHVQSVKESSGLTPLRSVWLVSTGLLGLLKQISIQPANMSTSALRTIAVAIDSLELLSTRTVRTDLATEPPIRLLSVDDDAMSRRAIASALKKILAEPDMAGDGPGALVLAEQRAYDVIFLDIEMPGMNGFELCSKIRQTQCNRTTPIVFVTHHFDFDSRAKSVLAGAHELIAKPFLAFEISLKALTLVLKTRQEREARNILGQVAAPHERSLSAGPARPSFCSGAS
jgi:CheY-like chemotaxis protein